jgi:flagellar hook-associated protein 2
MPVATFSGIASGIDTKSLIAASVDAQKKLKITPKEEDKTIINEETDAIKEMKTKVENFRLALQDFSTINGGGLSKKATSTDESAISATATNNATNGTYSLTVNQLATTGTFSFNDRFASGTSTAAPTINDLAPAADRTITFTVGTGTTQQTVDVVLTSTSTANDILDQFNASATNARATLVNVGTAASPSYAITINSTEPGTSSGSLAVALGAEFTAGLSTYTLTQAKDSNFSVSGIAGTITRSSNTVTDIIDGLTMQLQGVGASTITVGADGDTTAGKLKDLVKQYNGIATYIKENDVISIEQDGKDSNSKPIYGSLARASVDDDMLSALKNTISGAVASDGTSVRIFADIGITTERDGTLKFNEDTFNKALAEDPNGLEQLLTSYADTNSVTGGPLRIYTQFQGILDNAISSNDTQIRDLNERISSAEASIASLEQSLTARFSRMEVAIGKMQSQGNSLSSALAGIK